MPTCYIGCMPLALGWVHHLVPAWVTGHDRSGVASTHRPGLRASCACHAVEGHAAHPTIALAVHGHIRLVYSLRLPTATCHTVPHVVEALWTRAAYSYPI